MGPQLCKRGRTIFRSGCLKRQCPDLLKSELYNLVKKHKPDPEYVCDRMTLEQGFVVVILPPYHCILNPIELVWACIKGRVTKENKTFKRKDVMALTNEAISVATLDQWCSACLHCRKLVDEFWKTDCLQEEAVEQFVIELNSSHNDADDGGDNDDRVSNYLFVIELISQFKFMISISC